MAMVSNLGLERNSLYIATEEAHSRWSLFITDGSGGAIVHRWLILYGGKYAVNGVLVEVDIPVAPGKYQQHIIKDIKEFNSSSKYLSFTKINGWRTPFLNDLNTCLSGIFGTRHADVVFTQTASQNDRMSHDWVLNAIRKFEDKKWSRLIFPNNRDRKFDMFKVIERNVIDQSHLAADDLVKYGEVHFTPRVDSVGF